MAVIVDDFLEPDITRGSRVADDITPSAIADYSRAVHYAVTRDLDPEIPRARRSKYHNARRLRARAKQ